MTVNQAKGFFKMQLYILLIKLPFVLYLCTDTLYPQYPLGKHAVILPSKSLPTSSLVAVKCTSICNIKP